MKDLPSDLRWLADAPMFIDEDQVHRFYDAVVRPESREGNTRLQLNEESLLNLSGKLGLGAEASAGDVLGSLSGIFPSLTFKAEGELVTEYTEEQEESLTVEFHPIRNAERQLVQLSLHYSINLDDRIFFVQDTSREDWRTDESVSSIPRSLVFLNLPGEREAGEEGHPTAKLIPTAAEFVDGEIDLVYERLAEKLEGELPEYPEQADTYEQLRANRKEYWKWFDERFSATQAMIAVEEAVRGKEERISWIDYRVPLTDQGDTLHLHVCPSGNYDTGVFAYNFIKRGYKHGLRLVGTLKSEPDMNVLAIYEK
jgi:hypothetical protein